MKDQKQNHLKSENPLSNRINWFPGHMAKAFKEVQKKVKLVDLVIEVRDARVPLSSGNNALQKMLGNKPRMIVFNKSNLAEQEVVSQWQKWFLDKNISAIFINALEKKSLNLLSKTAKQIMKEKWKTFQDKGIRPPPLRMMMIGIPNTGKSTIINRLTNRNAAQTGNRPGVTRNQEWIVLAKNMELLDTPGIMPPRIDTEEQGYWLCAIHAIKDQILGEERVARFVVNYLINKNQSELLKHYQLESLDHQPEDLILMIGETLNFKKKKSEIDYTKSCSHILKDFRLGNLGRCSFEFPSMVK